MTAVAEAALEQVHLDEGVQGAKKEAHHTEAFFAGREFPGGQRGIAVEFAKKMPTDECEIFIPHMEGYPSRIPENETAFAHRNTPFVLNIHTRWRKEEDDKRSIDWARGIHKATEPYSQGVYVNFISQEGADRVRDAYTPEVWERLVQVKRKYDPGNIFKLNQNIKP